MHHYVYGGGIFGVLTLYDKRLINRGLHRKSQKVILGIVKHKRTPNEIKSLEKSSLKQQSRQRRDSC